MLSKRISSSLYAALCPRCGYRTSFAASNLIEREYRNLQGRELTHDLIATDIKCQMCLMRFDPAKRKPMNFYPQMMQARDVTPLHTYYMGQMKTYVAMVPDSVGGILLGHRTSQMRHSPQFDGFSILFADEFSSVDGTRKVCLTGHNLTQEVVSCTLGLTNIVEMSPQDAIALHFNEMPRAMGAVSYVTRV